MPQEIEVWYVLPAIRKELAKEMLKQGLKQKDIAKKLGVTEPAISQYLKSKRAKKVKFNKEVNIQIKTSAILLIKNKSCAIKEMQKCCKEIKNQGILCKLHKGEGYITGSCRACLS